MKEEKAKEKKPLWRRILNWVFSILGIGIIGFALAFQINGWVTSKDHHGVNVFMGHATCIVITDSMEPEYPVGSALFIKTVKPEEIKLEDDLTFFYSEWNVVVTHRVSDISYDETTGIYTFTLHGINEDSNQCSGDCTGQTQVITQDDVIGKVVGVSVGFGKVYDFITSVAGLFVLLLIPAGYLVVVSIIDIVKALKMKDEEDINNAEAKLEEEKKEGENLLSNLSEEDIKRLKEEYLQKLLEERENRK